jgi:hypothetical protein
MALSELMVKAVTRQQQLSMVLRLRVAVAVAEVQFGPPIIAAAQVKICLQVSAESESAPGELLLLAALVEHEVRLSQ